jgi:hypothetical protein
LSVQITITLPKPLYERLLKRCNEAGMTFDTCIARAVIQLVEQEVKRG